MSYLRRNNKPPTGPPIPWETLVPGFVDRVVHDTDQYIALLLSNGAEEEDIAQHLKEMEDDDRRYQSDIGLRALARIRLRRQLF